MNRISIASYRLTSANQLNGKKALSLVNHTLIKASREKSENVFCINSGMEPIALLKQMP